MNICLPVDNLQGLESRIFPNLRAAPALLIIDSQSGQTWGIDTTSGVCGAIPVDIDALIFVDGIGRGMFNGLQRQGIRVFATTAATVKDALEQLASGQLQEVLEVAASSGGGHQAQTGANTSGCGCHGHEGQHPHNHGCGCQH